MKKQFYTIAMLLLLATAANAQVGIGTTTPDASSSLDITSTTSGLLKPRMTTAQRTAIATPAKGLEVFDTTTNTTWFFNGTVWVNNAPDLRAVSAFNTQFNHITFDAGNGGTGTNGGYVDNIGIGREALFSITGGDNNIVVGASAGRSITTGVQNTLLGSNSGSAVTTGKQNTLVGDHAAQSLNTGEVNTYIGSYAANSATSGRENVAVGFLAGANMTSGGYNTALGVISLSGVNNTGSYNTSVGYGSMSNTTSLSGTGGNAAVGINSLNNLSGTAKDNNGFGWLAGANITTGTQNTAIGSYALGRSNGLAGSLNTAIGFESLSLLTNGGSNSALGEKSTHKLITGSGNVALGAYSAGDLSVGSNNISIGTSQNFQYSNNNPNNPASSSRSDYQLNIGNSISAANLDGKGPNNHVTVSIGNNNGVIWQPNNYNYTLDIGGKTHINDGLDIQSAGQPLMNISTTTSAVYSVPANASGNVYYEIAGTENHVFGGNVVADSGSSYTLGLPTDPWGGLYTGFINAGGTIFYGGLSGGHHTPAANNTYDLGSTTLRWRTIYSNSVLNTSDARLKTNIKDASYGLSSVMKMRPVTYNWKTDPNANHMVGFLAQDMEKIVPEAVYVPKTADENYAINYTELIPILTKAIQEQQAEITTLRSKLEKMEKAIEALTAAK